MGQVTIAEAVEVLRKDNPTAQSRDLEMYARLFVEYMEADRNIQQNGTIVAHPRTGTPIENPYYKIRAAVGKGIRTFPRLKTDALWDSVNHG